MSLTIQILKQLLKIIGHYKALLMGFFSKLFGQKAAGKPEDNYVTTVTDKYIRVEHPSRKTEQINWDDIVEIRLVNADERPIAPDIWLLLIGDDSGCSIPHGSKGYEQVYDIVSKYEDFNFENVIKSMSSTGNEQFVLWIKK
jgi:hypothetical protein